RVWATLRLQRSERRVRDRNGMKSGKRREWGGTGGALACSICRTQDATARGRQLEGWCIILAAARAHPPGPPAAAGRTAVVRSPRTARRGV
ncbi:MAG: hypothetical protein WCP73_07790, partial [Eubacteriales bacterium]